jgi:RecA-family ATPase
MKMAEEWHESAPEPEKPPAFVPLTIRKPSEILAMEFSDEDFLLDGGYLAKGDPIAICGAPGVGKSRLSMQLIIALVTGRPFLGWQTNGKGTRWLILQTENSNRRLKYELSNMMSDLTKAERQAVDDGIDIHTLETAEDSFVSLKVLENETRISALIQKREYAGILFDVLRDFQVGDLNGDEGMTATLSVIGRITRQGDPQRIPVILHHALTGKSGAARATGFDRGSFGRNSKVLLGWVRSQIQRCGT